MGGRRASTIEGLDVRYGDIRLGVVADVLLDAAGRSILALAVRCGDETHRFLPLRAADVQPARVVVGSPFVLLRDAFYDERAVPLASLRGAPVHRGDDELGSLQDVVLDADAAVAALLVSGPGGEREVELDERVTVAAKPLSRAV